MSEANPLERLRWRSRVLVIFAVEAGDGKLARQKQMIADVLEGATERDLVIIEAIGASRAARELRAQLDIPEGEFRSVLVGKDGGAKLISNEPVEPSRLFATIDAMPMRQQEMCRK